tara:strand:+ start:12577 stop:12888 length:312 start_codon:yes stop_codon:yes gene_type:complete
MEITDSNIKYIAKHFNMDLKIDALDDNLVYFTKYEEEVATDIGEFRLVCDAELHFTEDGDAYKHYLEKLELWGYEDEVELSIENKKDIEEILRVQLYQNNKLN